MGIQEKNNTQAQHDSLETEAITDFTEKTEQEGFSFSHGDGQVEHASSMEDALSRCPYLGRLAIENPELFEKAMRSKLLRKVFEKPHPDNQEEVSPHKAEKPKNSVDDKKESVAIAPIKHDTPQVQPQINNIAVKEALLANTLDDQTEGSTTEPETQTPATKLERTEQQALDVATETYSAQKKSPESPANEVKAAKPDVEPLTPSHKPSLTKTKTEQPKPAVSKTPTTAIDVLKIDKKPGKNPSLVDDSLATEVETPSQETIDFMIIENEVIRPEIETESTVSQPAEISPEQPITETYQASAGLESLARRLYEVINPEQTTETNAAEISEVTEIIKELTVELEAISTDSDDEISITPELTHQILLILEKVGYEEPSETLISYVEENGAESLIELLQELIEDDGNESLQISTKLKKLTTTAKLKAGKMIIALLTRYTYETA